jgi:hypothetical protein
VAVNVAYLTGSVDVRCGLAIQTTSATIEAMVLAIIIAARTVLAIIITVAPWAVLTVIIAVVLTRTILTIIIAKILAAWATILARKIVRPRATFILTRTSVTLGDIRRGDKTRIFRLVFMIKFLNLTKEICKRGVWVCTNSGVKAVIPSAETMQDIVDKLIII